MFKCHDKKQISKRMQERRLKWYGHVMRREVVQDSCKTSNDLCSAIKYRDTLHLLTV